MMKQQTTAEMPIRPGQALHALQSELKPPWREAGPPNHHDDQVDSDQYHTTMKQQTTAEMPIRPGQASPIGRSTQHVNMLFWGVKMLS